jgi:drug/metabolite transporter (DMT)-like permease
MRPQHVARLLLLALLWGGSYLFMRSAAPQFGAGPMIFLRMALGSLLVLLPLTLWRIGFAPIRRHWRPMAVMGVVFTALPFMGLGYAALSITAGLMAVIQSAAPLFSAIVGRIWLGEPIRPMRAVGLVVGLSGVALLVWDKVGMRDDAGIGILITLLMTVLWGVSSNFVRVRLAGVDPLATATGAITAAALVLAPMALLTWPAEPPSIRAWAEVVFLGVAASGLGFILYYSLIAAIGAVRATSVTFLTPIVTMALGTVYLDEPITVRIAIGCAVILIGTALTLGFVPAFLLPKSRP